MKNVVLIVKDEEKVLEAGCDGYISKPIDIKAFLRKVEEFLNKSD